MWAATELSGVIWWRKWHLHWILKDQAKPTIRNGRKRAFQQGNILCKGRDSGKKVGCLGFCKEASVAKRNHLGGQYSEMKMERWAGRTLASVLQGTREAVCPGLSQVVNGKAMKIVQACMLHVCLSEPTFVGIFIELINMYCQPMLHGHNIFSATQDPCLHGAIYCSFPWVMLHPWRAKGGQENFHL